MMTRFDLMVFAMILAGIDFAVPVQETFESNREQILAESTSVIGDLVFSVGRAKQTLRAGDEVGFSKAATLAFANLDFLNFKNVQWPASVEADEKKAVWIIYRSEHPFGLTIEGGQRVYSNKTDNDKYLVVMAFPREKVFMDTSRREDIEAAISQYRDELKRMAEEANRIIAERSATNGLDVQKAQIDDQLDDNGKVKKYENFDADLIL